MNDKKLLAEAKADGNWEDAVDKVIEYHLSNGAIGDIAPTAAQIVLEGFMRPSQDQIDFISSKLMEEAMNSDEWFHGVDETRYNYTYC